MSNKNVGTVVQVIGPVLDIRFADGSCPTFATPLSWTTTASVWWWRWHSTLATMWPAALP